MIFKRRGGWTFSCDICLSRRRESVKHKGAACKKLLLAGWYAMPDGSVVCPQCVAEMQVATKAKSN